MVYMIKEKIIKKDRFVIGDFAIIVNKKSDTIRNWEERGIIEKPTVNPKTKWREYTREELICNLKKVLNFNWDRNTLDRDEIEEYIKRLEAPPLCSLSKNKLC